MTTKRLSAYLIPSVSEVLFLSIFLFLALYRGIELLNDADTGYHIRAGEHILATRSIPYYDLFSFLQPPLPWTAHEWLAEVIMALVHRPFGLTGLVIFFAFLIASTYLLVFNGLRRDNGSLYGAVALTILVFASSQIHWLARPHIFSLVLMAYWYRCLHDLQYRDNNRLSWLPLVMLLWVNLHGGYVVGFVLLGLFLAGNLLAAWYSQGDERQAALRRATVLSRCTALSLCAALVNPFGYRILLFPFELVGNKYLMDHVSEFVSPNFHEPLPFKYLLLLTIILLAASRRRSNPVELCLVLFFTNMALISIRYVTLYAIVVAPIVMVRLDDLARTGQGRLAAFVRRRDELATELDERAAGRTWIAVGLLAVLLLMVERRIEFRFNPAIKPVAAVEFLQREQIDGNMFNNDEMGDYIIYAAWPRYRVFFDGRSDMYGVARLKEYFRVTAFEPGWEAVLTKYGIDWIIYDASSALSRFLNERPDWRLIYADRLTHIYVRDIPRYRHLIEKYRHVRPLPPEAERKAAP